MKKSFLNGLVFVALTLCFGMAASAQLGGYKEASTTDERVVAAAEFAVGKQEEEEEGLTLVSIEHAQTQVVAGINYKLCLKVKLGDETQEVMAIVYQKGKEEYQLTSWKVEDCGE